MKTEQTPLFPELASQFPEPSGLPHLMPGTGIMPGYKRVQGGNVPGGHNVLWDGKRKPFITPVKEMNSIPLRHSDVVVDIGAYVGTYAIRCARFPVKKVIAYEPTPATFLVLSLTKLPNMELINSAVVGDDRKSVELFISGGIGVTNSIILSNRKAAEVSVPAVNYVDAVREASIVKIDVEGAEYDYPIVQPQIRALIIDFHPITGENWMAKAKALIETILASGFTTVVTPVFSSGWTSAGSWIRPMETTGEFEPMMRGQLCCGCGAEIVGHKKSLCPSCFGNWLPKHREGFDGSMLRCLNT